MVLTLRIMQPKGRDSGASRFERTVHLAGGGDRVIHDRQAEGQEDMGEGGVGEGELLGIHDLGPAGPEFGLGHWLKTLIIGGAMSVAWILMVGGGVVARMLSVTGPRPHAASWMTASAGKGGLWRRVIVCRAISRVSWAPIILNSLLSKGIAFFGTKLMGADMLATCSQLDARAFDGYLYDFVLMCMNLFCT